MTMPKASVNKNNRFIFGQNQIRIAGQIVDVFFVSESLREQVFANYRLRFCILTGYMRHDLTAFPNGIYIIHYLHLERP